MHLKWTAIFFASLSVTGQALSVQDLNLPCGTSKTCAENCPDGDFHVYGYEQLDGPFFACQVGPEVSYTYTSCLGINVLPLIHGIPSLCQVVGAQSCTVFCVMPTYLTGAFENICTAMGGITQTNAESASYQQVAKDAGCLGLF